MKAAPAPDHLIQAVRSLLSSASLLPVTPTVQWVTSIQRNLENAVAHARLRPA